ncbi:hypothetical protein GCM10027046_08500 [Uliginosibacterium flavum]
MTVALALPPEELELDEEELLELDEELELLEEELDELELLLEELDELEELELLLGLLEIEHSLVPPATLVPAPKVASLQTKLPERTL